MTPEQLSPIDVAPSKSDIPQVLSSGQNFPRLTGVELQVFSQLLSGSAENPIQKSRLEVSASLLSSLRAKLGGIGDIINATDPSKRRIGWESTYCFSAFEGIDPSELKKFVEERINTTNLSSLGDMIRQAAQKQGLDADSLSPDSNRYARIRKGIIEIMGRLGIKPIMNRGNTFLYAEEDTSKILEKTTPIKIRKPSKEPVKRIYLKDEDYEEGEKVLRFPEDLIPEELQQLKVGVTTCLLSFLAVEGELDKCSKTPREVLTTYLNGAKKFNLAKIPEEELREFLVYQVSIPTIEKFWHPETESEESFDLQVAIRRLKKYLDQVKDRFSKEEIVRSICGHFEVEIPEKYSKIGEFGRRLA